MRMMRTMSTWRRAYHSDRGTLHTLRYVVAGGMSVAGLAPLCGLASERIGTAGQLVIVLFVLMWEAAVWRTVLVGVYVSDYGVKIRTVLHTRIIAWSRVSRVWAGPAVSYDAWQIWISRHDPERDFPTPIWRRGSRSRHRNRIVLSPDEFAAVLSRLNAHR